MWRFSNMLGSAGQRMWYWDKDMIPINILHSRHNGTTTTTRLYIPCSTSSPDLWPIRVYWWPGRYWKMFVVVICWHCDPDIDVDCFIKENSCTVRGVWFWYWHSRGSNYLNKSCSVYVNLLSPRLTSTKDMIVSGLLV